MGKALFDENFFLYGEDVDLDWRAQLRGMSCWYTPDAIAYHRGSHLSSDLEAMALANRMLSAIKNACLLHLLLIVLPTTVFHILFRIFVTPGIGLKIANQVIVLLPNIWKKRESKQKKQCLMMQGWFRWSGNQSSIYRSYPSRLRAFREKRYSQHSGV